MAQTIQKISFGEKVGYSLGDGAANLVFQMLMTFQLFFYTDVLGIKGSSASVILMIALVFNAVVDPIVGILSDRTNTKWGKYRPWILWTAIPFALIFVLTYYTPDFSENGKVLYAGITYILLMSVYSFNNTPYSSLGGVMTGDAKERTSIASIRFVAATTAGFVVQGLTLPLVSKFGQGDSHRGWFITILIFAMLVVTLLVVSFLSTKERIAPPVNQKTSVKQDLKDTFSSKPWKAMFALTLFLFITLAMWASGMSYYFNYYVDKDALYHFLQQFNLVDTHGQHQGWLYNVLDALGLIAKNPANVFAVGFSFFNMTNQLFIIGGVIFLSQFLSNRFGKKNVYLICLSLAALITGSLYFIPAHRVDLIFTFGLLRSLVYAPTIPLLWAMIGDVADHSEWVNHRRATGFVFAGIVFALKAGLVMGGAICGALMDNFGFVPNTVQTAASIIGIKLTISILPGITYLAGVTALLFYPIGTALNTKIQAELSERRRN
jgi:glycoside/pentoside/hexuronide:cation symporter, GPH family